MSHPVNTLRPTARSAAAAESRAAARGDRGAPPARERAVGAPYREQADWAQAALFAAGVALGALVGASAALLTAPRSGVETRLALKRRARRVRVEAEDRWDGLGRELRMATRRRKRELRRKLAASRWRAADAVEP